MHHPDAERATSDFHEFLGLLGHELRNPLAAIMTAVQVLRRIDPRGPDVERMYAVIENGSSQMRELIDRFLEISRIGRGKLLLDRQPADLAEIIRGAVERHRTAIGAAGLTIVVAMPDEPIPVLVDQKRIGQVLDQAIDNARKYTPPGGLVEVSAAARDGFAEVTIRDEGEGMTMETLRAVQEPFRLKPGFERSGGLGLGLSLARGLAELHGGDLDLCSDGPGHGTTVALRLPLHAASPQQTGRYDDARPREVAPRQSGQWDVVPGV